MSEEEDVYNGLIESINQNEGKIKKVFQKYAKSGPAIELKNIPALLNEVGDILDFDCEDANQFFSHDNSMIPQGYNINLLVYSQFMDIFKLWLKNEADGEEEEEGDEPASPQKALNTAQDTSFTEKKQTEANEDNGIYPGLPQRYAKNAKLLNKLIETNRDDFQAVFYEKLHVEGQEAVVIQECYGFLQECFTLDSIEIKANPDDQEDFFQSGNGEPKFYELAHRYFIEERGADPDTFELEKAALTFDECFHLLDYLLRKDDNIVLVNHRKADDEDAVKATLLETIEKYEKLIEDSKNKVEKQILQGTVDTLKAKLRELEVQRGSATPDVDGKEEETKGESKADKRTRSLKEIFDFYCAQQLNVGRAATFDRLDRISRTINLGTFKVILKNFRLKMSTLNLIDLYNKCSGLDENLQYDEFESLLNKVALRVDLAGEEKTHEPRPEIRKNYKPDSYKKDDSYKQWKQNDDKRREEARSEIIKKASNCYVNDPKREEEKLEEVWRHMGLYDGSFRSKMGMVQLAFNSQDKENFRIPVGSLKYKYRKRAMEGKTSEEVQLEVQRRNELRRLVKDLKTLQSSVAPRPSAQAGKSKGLVQRRRNHKTYLERQLDKAKLHPGPDVTKLSLTKVETIHYHDMNKVNDLFNPHDLIEENDHEDNLYLAEYNIQNEREQIKDMKQNDKRRADQYGKLKKPAQLLPNDHGARGHSNKDIEAIIGYNPDSYDYDDHSYYYRNSQAGSKSYEMPRGVVSTKAKKAMAPTYDDYDSSYQHHSSPQKNSYVYAGQQYGQGYHAPVSPSYNTALERANQVERNMRKKEQQMINNIMSIQNNQVKKGMKAVGK